MCWSVGWTLYVHGAGHHTVQSIFCAFAERLDVQRAGPVCFYEVLAPYYYQVISLSGIYICQLYP